jgi:DNA repair exonuclease SbcCD ATPase subunit
MSPPLSTHPQGLIKGDAPFYEEVTTPFHPTPLGLIGGRYTTSTPVAGQHVTPVGGQHVTPVGGRHATPVATVGRTTAPVDAQVQSDVKFIDQNIEVAPPSPYQNVEVVPPSPYQNVKVAPPSPHQNIKVAPPSPHQPNSPSLSSSTTNEDNRYSADLVDGIQETHKHILDKMKAQSDELYASFKAVSAKNTELLSENVTLKLKENRIDNLEKRLKQVKEERDQLQASLREKAHDVTMKEEECAHFESELTHLRKENLDYSRRLSQAREQVQGQKKDPRVLEELSKAMADKEALEKHCHQLQRTNSELKEELSRAVSQSISLQEHKAALDEIQEMVATDAQSGKEELAHKIKVMKRERKALLEQLAEYKVSASQLEQKCLFLEESAAEVASRMSSLEDEVESSRDREAVAHSQLSKAVSQAERALGERDSLSRLLKSHRELSASKEAKSKEKIRCLQKRLQVSHMISSITHSTSATNCCLLC